MNEKPLTHSMKVDDLKQIMYHVENMLHPKVDVKALEREKYAKNYVGELDFIRATLEVAQEVMDNSFREAQRIKDMLPKGLD